MLIFAKIAPLKIKKEHKMNDICVMILAAGEGTRMKSTKPKVLHEICGKSMLYHSINTALEISQNVVVILGFESQRILEHLNLEFPSQMGKEIKTALQDRKNLPGTAGAVMAGMSEVSKDTLIITCADMPLITASELKSLANEPCDVCVGA
ncbi:MAG: NTP transferase domain-containing protein, partial [Campylobacter sp.]|nr:NTP transferase domain-containing protein [Campylobacter sp.]